MSQVFLTDSVRLRSECEREPYADLRALLLMERRIGRREVRQIHKGLLLVLNRLINDQRFLLFESVRTSPKLGRLKRIRIDVVVDDHPYAFANPSRNAISIYTGLIKEDLVQVIASPAPLCTMFGLSFNSGSRKSEFYRTQVNTVSAAFEFVVAFQILHEMAHVILQHTVLNQKCEESEADRFAFDYLYAVRNVILAFPRAYLPLDSMWPPYPNSPTASESNYPTRPDREDQAWRTKVLRNMTFGNITSNKLDLPGAIVGNSFLDADLYASNFSLDGFLKNGSTCHTVEPRPE